MVCVEVDCIDFDSGCEVICVVLFELFYLCLLLVCDGCVEELLGYVYKKELFKELFVGVQLDLESLVCQLFNLLQDCLIFNVLEQMCEVLIYVVFVVNEFGEFIGLLILIDIFEFIVGELFDVSEIDGLDVVEENDGYLVSGVMNFSQVC